MAQMIRIGTQVGGNLQKKLEDAMDKANEANEQRYQQAMAIYDEVISRYSPGGAFQKASLAELEKTKVRDVGAETQRLISSGLSGTTYGAQTGQRWESSVGAGARLKLEDLMMERLSQAQLGKAGLVERRQDVGPSYSDLMNISSQTGGGSNVGFGSTGELRSSKSYSGSVDLGNYMERAFGEWGSLRTGSSSTGGSSTGGTSGGGGDISTSGQPRAGEVGMAAKQTARQGALSNPGTPSHYTDENGVEWMYVVEGGWLKTLKKVGGQWKKVGSTQIPGG